MSLTNNVLNTFFVQYLSDFLKRILNTLPVRAKALFFYAFALTGRMANLLYKTQGVALGYVLIGLSVRIFLNQKLKLITKLNEEI